MSNVYTHSDALKAAESLKREAKAILGNFITDQVQADRFVDCIIGSAMLEVATMQAKAITEAFPHD